MGHEIAFRFDKGIDVGAWLALFRAAGYNDWWTERHAKAALSHAHTIITAWKEDTLVGTLTIQSDGVNFAVIDDVVVHPDCQGSGIGSRLMREAMVRITAMNVDHMQLYPIPGRESFFARFGFSVQPSATVMDWTGGIWKS